ncbi:MAG: Zn-dependent oligopeptidase [Alkalinema sp. RU_4_3]|nr:Zn-dependent oligopeptidase [Alkalinema sp. RU_4_3]
MTFSETIEAIKSLSVEEKLEVQKLLQQYLRDERREEIYRNSKAAQAEQQANKLRFSSNINELKQMIQED